MMYLFSIFDTIWECVKCACHVCEIVRERERCTCRYVGDVYLSMLAMSASAKN